MRPLCLLTLALLSACSSRPLTAEFDAGANVETPPDLRPQDAGRDLVSDSDAGFDASGFDAAIFIEPCSVKAPTSCPVPAPTYADVAAVISARCYACHDGSGPQWGLTNYQHVSDWQDTIHDEVLGCTMPPLDASVPITNAERALILTWLYCGLPK